MKALAKAMLLGVALAAGVVSFGAAPFSSPAGAETRWQPAPGTSWQWQLSSRPEALLDVDAYDLDGFDAVEPDNMDGYQNRTGFKITSAQQLRYNTFLAETAHERGLAIAMKNDPDQVDDLVDLYDFAITEDCFDQGWCNDMSPFVAQNKAVLAAEYTDTGARLSRFCPKAASLEFDAILKKRNLGAWRRSC